MRRKEGVTLIHVCLDKSVRERYSERMTPSLAVDQDLRIDSLMWIGCSLMGVR